MGLFFIIRAFFTLKDFYFQRLLCLYPQINTRLSPGYAETIDQWESKYFPNVIKCLHTLGKALNFSTSNSLLMSTSEQG